MISKGTFRGLRTENGPRPQRLITAERPGWPPAPQAARRYTTLIRRAALPAGDALAVSLAALLTATDWETAAYAAAVLALLRFSGRQRLRICLRASDEITRLAAAAVLPLPLFLFVMNRGGLDRLVALCGVLLVTTRLALYATIRAANRHQWLGERVLIIGSGKLGVEIWELLHEHSELGLRPIGFIDNPGLHSAGSLPLLGTISEIPDVMSSFNVRRVIITPSGYGDAVLVPALRGSRDLAADVYVVPRVHELAEAVPAVYRDDIWGIPLVLLRRPGLLRSRQAMKRAFDIVAGSVLLGLFAPLLGLLILGVLLSCGRPVLFRQARVTRSGRIMKITKLRTVTNGDMGGRWTVSPEDCSALGRWLRATHLDELPQLLDVVRGDMSLVGPRPERPYFASQFSDVVPRYEDRLRVNGGMTGWAQVHGLTGDTSIHERVRFDNNYIEHWSLWLDLVILVRTLAKPLAGAGRRRSGEFGQREGAVTARGDEEVLPAGGGQESL